LTPLSSSLSEPQRAGQLTGRLTELVVPAAELATVVHAGSYRDFDLAYGALATHVAQHAIAIDGPIREYFLVGPQDTRDETAWRTRLAGRSFTPRLKPADLALFSGKAIDVPSMFICSQSD